MQQNMIIPNDFNVVKNDYIPENIYVNMYLLNSNSFIYKYVIMRCTVQYSTRRYKGNNLRHSIDVLNT